MVLNSLDIQNKLFGRQWRGYNHQEVDEFLQIVISDYDEMTQKIRSYERDLSVAKERLKDFDTMRDSLNKSLIVATETADNMKIKAEKESESIVAEAGKRANQILESCEREARRVLTESYDEALKLVHESDELKRNVRVYHQRISLLIQDQLNNIKSQEWEEMVRPVPVAIGDSEERLREIIETTNQISLPNLGVDPSGQDFGLPHENTETLDNFVSGLNPKPEPPVPELEKEPEPAPMLHQFEPAAVEEPKPEPPVIPTPASSPDPLGAGVMNLGGQLNFSTNNNDNQNKNE